jgi:hypothetical protein
MFLHPAKGIRYPVMRKAHHPHPILGEMKEELTA